MPKSLYGKLVVLMLVVLAVVGIVHASLMSRLAQLYFQEVTQDVNRDVAQQVAKRHEILAGKSFDRGALKRLFSQLMTTHPSIEVYALDPHGRILSFSAPPQAVVRDAVSLDPVRRFLAGQRLPVLGDDPRDSTGQKVFSVAPVPTSAGADAPLAGYIYVVLEGQPYQSSVQRIGASYILRQGVLAGAATLIVSLLAALYILKLLVRRTQRLADAMQAFEASGFSQPPPVAPRSGRKADEIERLESSFTVMAACIVEQVQKIRSVDSLRRDLLANLSHDLRTPLASLQGYLDTVLVKDGQLSPGQQDEFLRIAARHGERLARLIDDLSELAKLDSAQVPLNREPASMAELVQDALQKLQLSAQRKGVRLEAQLERQLPAVSVDVSQISRAIDNLLENALRYTHDGGTVRASVAAEAGKVVVCITDTGCGIAPEVLPRIFDRFYQVGAPAPAQNGGVGLGLAITKHILDLHGAVLAVTSTVDVGTSFSFELLPVKNVSQAAPVVNTARSA